MEIKSARIEKKKSKKDIPKDSIKGKKELQDVRVEEIQNGYIITKEFKTHYTTKDGYKDYLWENEKYFSDTNPLKITLDNKSLADKF